MENYEREMITQLVKAQEGLFWAGWHAIRALKTKIRKNGQSSDDDWTDGDLEEIIGHALNGLPITEKGSRATLMRCIYED